MADITPSQTVGPYFAYGLTPKGVYDWSELAGNNLVTPDVSGEKIRIEGRVLDGDGNPLPDSMLEIWQADASGRYAHPADSRSLPNAAFRGHGRTGTDDDGRFFFSTIKPGPVPGPNGRIQAPHISLTVFARGMLTHCTTRIYFEDEAANESDPILALVPAERRATLIARKADGGAAYVFDVRLQGENETVFFEV